MAQAGEGLGLRAVVADDEPRMRELLAGILANAGFDVAQASNGLEALDLLRQSPTDMLVSDIMMPGMDGLAVVELAREVSPHTASVLITGQASLGRARGATRHGACDFLPKPFSHRELVEAVHTALARRASEEELARQRELRDLFELSRAATDSTDHARFLEQCLNAAVAQTRSGVGWIAAASGSEVRITAAVPGTDLRPDEPVPQSSLLRRVMEQGEPQLLWEGAPHPLASATRTVGHREATCPVEVTEALGFPIIAAGEVVGALAVGRTGTGVTYTKGDLQLLGVLAAQAGLLIRNEGLLQDLEQAYVGTVRAMALIVEARDPYTHGHSQRVAEICAQLAVSLDVGPEEANTLQTAAGLHDIGKVAVPDAVLRKPGRLTDREMGVIRVHPVVGAEVLSPASFLGGVRPHVLHHHERYDGCGYPSALRGSDICEATHLIIGADAWDAMTSHRPYRPALTTEEALREVERARGTQLHPDVADALIGVFGVGV